MDPIVVAVISITVIGIICGTLLSIASKAMYVSVDERILEIQDALPGTNCGACGFPGGCSGYANALNGDANVRTNLCTPGGEKVARRLSEILGVEAVAATTKLAVVHCQGDCNSLQKKMDYQGIKTCKAAVQLFGGEGACTYGCLGYGDCLAACPYGAICVKSGLARIDTKLCTGCGLCVNACPNDLITIENNTVTTVIVCKNLEKGAIVRKKCSCCCLGCGKCARECPSGALFVEDFLAKIDYEKCTNCGHCSEVCVTHCIKPFGRKQ